MSLLSNKMRKMFFWLFQWLYSKILSFVYGGAPKTIPTTKNSILMESASSLAQRIRSQKVTSVEVVQCYINRIEEVNEVLNCVVDERFEEALMEAEKADEVIRSGVKTEEELEAETPFLGVPFTVPESVPVKGLLNAMGTPSRKETKAHADCSVVSQMKEGGAIPIACTNVAEGCTIAWETDNPLFGRTYNPYDTNRTVGGPFGGEACLIASSGSPLGVAPSMGLVCTFNGIFGHKPTASVCREGPMSRNSTDLLMGLKLLAKTSKTDLKLDEPVDVKKLKYYYMDGDGESWFFSPVSEDIKEAIKKAVEHFGKSHGASVKRVDLKAMEKAFSICMAKANEASAKKKVETRKELIKALFGKSRHTFPFLFAALIEELNSRNINSKQTEEDCKVLLAELEALLGSDGVFIYPTQPTTAFRHNESLTRGPNSCFADIFGVLGLPTTYCPAGQDEEGLPMGLQVVAGANHDRLTLAVAREMEKLFGGWKPPPTHGIFTLKNSVFHNSLNEKLKTL